VVAVGLERRRPLAAGVRRHRRPPLPALGTPKDAPAVVPPAIPAPARNPGKSPAPQSPPVPLRHMRAEGNSAMPSPSPQHDLPRVPRLLTSD